MSELVVNMPVDGENAVVEMEVNVEYTDGGGTSDYKKLTNKPKINGTELVDNYNEIDPTVPSWAKQSTKPTYTASEVGALSEDTVIPTRVSDLTDASNYLKTTDISDWAKATAKPTYTAEEVGALPDTTTIPSSLADLTEDTTHQTVTQADKDKWNAGGGSNVVVTQIQTTGTKIASVTVDDTITDLYAPKSETSGSVVTYSQTVTSGTEIGKITIDGNETKLLCPEVEEMTYSETMAELNKES